MNGAPEILCDKCGKPMVQDGQSPMRSLDLYSGSTNIAHTSVATSVTTYPYGTNTMPTSSGTGHQPDSVPFQREPIKIRNYTCPSCNWKKQVRE